MWVSSKQNQVENDIVSFTRGTTAFIIKKKDQEREIRIQTIYNDRENREVLYRQNKCL
jgi:hypothetical protein